MIQKAKDRIVSLLAHGGFKRYVANAGWMFVARIANMAIAFVATAYVVRYLGPTNYGELSYAVSFVGLFSVFVSLGIDTVLYRDVVAHKERKGVFLGTAFRIKLIAAALMVVVTGVVAHLFSAKDVSLYLILIISSTYVFSAFNIISYEFQADVNIKRLAFISLISTLSANIAKVIVCIMDQGVIYLAACTILEGVISVGLQMYAQKRTYGGIRSWTYDKTIAKAMLLASWPLLLSNAFAVVYTRIDQVMIKNMMDAASVGLYDAAARISELWYFLPAILVTTFFPAIINAKKTSEDLYAKRMSHMFRLVAGVAILFALPITLFAKPIINIIYGPAFIPAMTVLQIYVWGGIGVAVSYLVHAILLAENMQKTSLFISMVAMVLNVVLNLIFIPIYGIEGAAWATFVSYLANILTLFFLKSTRPILRTFLRLG